MAAAPPVVRPTWTRRVAAWTLLGFFGSLIALTFAAVYTSNAGDPITTGYLAGVASVVPILFVAVPYYATPIWAILVPLEADGVAQALARATSGLRVEPVAVREGTFARCVSVVRFDTPPCTVGWYPMADRSTTPQTGSTTVILRPRTRDRKAVAAFRERLARALLEAAASPA